jgi:hypothetical protein
MPRIGEKWKSDPDRCRYYRLRADKLEHQNAKILENLIPAKEIQSCLQAFAAAIEGKIRASSLDQTLQAELFDELADLPHRLAVNGKHGKNT